jgi:hypothetical protein
MADTTTATIASSSAFNATQNKQLMAAFKDKLSVTSGRGPAGSLLQTLLTRHDRYGTAQIEPNLETIGLTFITRPRLNLSTSSLRQDRQMALLDTMNPQALMFGVRCNLDTVFCRETNVHDAVYNSPWFNPQEAFNVPLGNMLTGVSGWPDFNLETETTEPGSFSESMTTARGSDRGRRGYTLNLSFRDMRGGVAFAMLYYWIHAIALSMEGIMVAYPEDREANRLNYTCSIYQFNLDPSQRTITKWAKATGCFPISMPMGEFFNHSMTDSHVHAASNFSVPFFANNISYMDPIHLKAFNVLVDRYQPGMKTLLNSSDHTQLPLAGQPHQAQYNFMGVPYIDLYSGSNELKWLVSKDEIAEFKKYDSTITSLTKALSSSTTSALASLYTNPKTTT